jgi:hypothetical protein
MAILDGPVALVEPAALGREIAQLRSLKPKPALGDLGMGAGSRLHLEVPGQALTEGPIKASVMRDDQLRRRDERLHCLKVEHLAGDHVRRNPGQASDFRTDRYARLTQGIESLDHITDPAFLIIGEGNHAEFDDLVPRMIETGTFGIERYRG